MEQNGTKLNGKEIKSLEKKDEQFVMITENNLECAQNRTSFVMIKG